MFGISFGELLLVFAIALIIFGPEKLPEFARTLGKLSGELRRNTDALRREFYNAVYPPAKQIKSDFNDTGDRLRSIGSQFEEEFLKQPESGASKPDEEKDHEQS